MNNKEKKDMSKVYTAQKNKFGNVIVCGDNIARNSYVIIYTGSYNECLAFKVGK